MARFNDTQIWFSNQYTYDSNWTSVNTYPRLVGDANGDGKYDIIAFGPLYVEVLLSTGSLFVDRVNNTDLNYWSQDFCLTSSIPFLSFDRNPRLVGDIDGDGRDDLIGFEDNDIKVALSEGNAFGPATTWFLNAYTYNSFWISFDKYPRIVADVNGDGKSDIVAFGERYVQVLLSTGSSFSNNNGFNYWSGDFAITSPLPFISFDRNPRLLADVNGDGKDDIIGFSDDDIKVALSLSNGSGFDAITTWLPNRYTYNTGWTSFNTYPRVVSDVDGDGKGDIIAFGQRYTYVLLSNGASFIDISDRSDSNYWSEDFTVTSAPPFLSFNRNPRLVGDVDGDGKADILGFGDASLYVASSSASLPLSAPGVLPLTIPFATPITLLPGTPVYVAVPIGVPVAVYVNVPIGIPIERYVTIPVGIPIGVPIEVPVGIPVAVRIESYVAIPVGVPIAVPVGIPVAVPIESYVAIPVGVPIEMPIGIPVAVPIGQPFLVPIGVPVGVPVGVPIGTPIAVQINVPVGMPIGVPVGVPIGIPIAVRINVPVGVPFKTVVPVVIQTEAPSILAVDAHVNGTALTKHDPSTWHPWGLFGLLAIPTSIFVGFLVAYKCYSHFAYRHHNNNDHMVAPHDASMMELGGAAMQYIVPNAAELSGISTTPGDS